MSVKHVAVSAELAECMRTGSLQAIHRPMQPQPYGVTAKQFFFWEPGRSIDVWAQDYPCQFGDPGDVLSLHFEGNPCSFREARVMLREVKPLSHVDSGEALCAGFSCLEAFRDFWDSFYGSTEFAACFDPWVWAVRINLF